MNGQEDHWLRRKAPTLVLLFLLFGLAFFLRSYFVWDLAAPEGLVSGGSDAFYYERIVRHTVETGKHLDFDPSLNYPTGVVNPRPPMFAWFSAVTGMALAPVLGADSWTTVSHVFLLSTAFWGALTVFPTYLLARDAFGRRAGVIAAFLIAVLPAHLQRSPATNGDHDSFVLFFVVTGFYFFLKALETLNEKRWVTSWRDRKAVVGGLRLFLQENRQPVLYSMLAGWCMATIALTWQGWAYAPIIILVYFLVQVFVHRLRNQDPMGITACFAIALGLPLLVAAPWYFPFGYVGTWYDVPAYLYAAALFLGILFTVTRDLPWALIVPTILGLAGAGLGVLALVSPAVANAFVSGAGYFVRTKAFETIAEAQAPGLSQAILSFGAASYYLSLTGLLLMAWQFGTGRNTKPFYLFALVWSVTAIFMSMAAARFIFNAAPAFAVTAAFVIVKVTDLLGFEEMKKRFASTSGGTWTATRKSVRVGHVLGALLLVFLVLMPNIFFATDAAIPYEKKGAFDQQLHSTLPTFLRPSGRDPDQGVYYFGAFGYSLPLTRNYYPAAWNWFATQDLDIPLQEDRPAYLSWWDYGFEAVDKGAHPTVADNFLDGYHLAGNFIAAQGEAEGIAYLSARLIEGDWRAHGKALGPEVRAILEVRGIDADRIHAVFTNAEPFKAEILADPARYGKRDSVLQPQNVWYIITKTELLEKQPGIEDQADLYRQIRLVTGWSIRYFAVDSRLFPTEGENTGIFYAPIKLSDHRVRTLRDGRTIPIDFFEIKADTQTGSDLDLDDVPSNAQITDLKILYEEMFYRSMFYRAYVGFTPKEAGASKDEGVPGISGPMQSQQPMPGWNLTHWRAVYATAYYSPYSTQEEVQAHREHTRAINYFEGLEIQRRKSQGLENGTVYLSLAQPISNGVVFLKYYDGAFLNGTLTVDGATPVPGAWVTVSDELDIPHQVVRTDERGRFAALAPFGTVKVSASAGALNGRTLVGATPLNTTTITVSDAAAMREEVDEDGDGIPDYLITLDLHARGVDVDGHVARDSDRNGRHDDNEPAVANALVELVHNQTRTFEASFRTTEAGLFRAEGVIQGPYLVNVTVDGRRVPAGTVNVRPGPDLEISLPVSELAGFAVDEDGASVAGAVVTLADGTTGETTQATADDGGAWSFEDLLPGPYNLTAAAGDRASLPEFVEITAADRYERNLTVHRSATLSGRTKIGAAPAPFVTLEIENLVDPAIAVSAVTDGNGAYAVTLPLGDYRVRSRHYQGGTLYAFAGEVVLRASGAALDIPLRLGVLVEGTVYGAHQTDFQRKTPVDFVGEAGVLTVLTNNGGGYTAYLPEGTYAVSAHGEGAALLTTLAATASGAVDGRLAFDLDLAPATAVNGVVYRDTNANGSLDASEELGGVRAAFAASGGAFYARTSENGTFIVALPAGSWAPSFSRFGYDTLSGPAASPGTLDGLRWALEASPIEVSGRVLLGTTAAGADVSVSFLRQNGTGPGVSVLTAADGRYRASPPPGEYTVDAQKGLEDAQLQLAAPINLTLALGDEPRTLDLASVRRTGVRGNVTLEDRGEPATVRFEGPEVTEVRANADGEFTAVLAEGTYTVTASLERDRINYLALDAVTVAPGATISLALDRATLVTGTVRHAGSILTSELDVTFTHGSGAAVTATTDRASLYRLDLLHGTYAVTIDAPGTVTVGGKPRLVRYTFSGTVEVPDQNSLTFDLEVARAFDNSTVEGRAFLGATGVPAAVRFLAADVNAINATAIADGTGAYRIALAPGNYTVHATHATSRSAFLGRLAVLPRTPAALDLPLAPAAELRGVLLATAPGTPTRSVAGAVTVSGEDGGVGLDATAEGGYVALLPFGPYSLSAGASLLERGVSSAYDGTAQVTLAADTVRDLSLTKNLRRTLSLTWPADQRTTIPQSGTVEYSLTVTNTGNVDDEYTMSASVAGWTFTFSPASVSVPFGSTGSTATVFATITAPADAGVDHPALVVTARSKADTTVRGTATVTADIQRVRAVSLARGTAAPSYDGTYLNVTVTVRNAGNAQETYTLALGNAADLAEFGWVPRFVRTGQVPEETVTNLTVAANATADVTLRLERLLDTPAAGSALLLVTDNADPASAATLTVELSLPRLEAQGGVDATGPQIEREAPTDWNVILVLLSLAAVVALGIYVYYRERFGR